MSKVGNGIFSFLFLLAFSSGMRAAVVSGTFPGGMSYYVVPNTTSKGYANFALVQKGPVNKEDARAGINLPFFSSKGIGYTADGFISYSGDSAVYRFEDVPTFQSVALDSTIVLLRDLADRYGGEQAVIVCGDIDASRIKDRLYMMSLTLKHRPSAETPPVPQWTPSRSLKIIHYQSGGENLSDIRFSYSSSRIPRKYMNTPQPLVSEMYARYLGYILRKRLESAFASRDVPLAYVRFGYLDSSRTPDDEQYYFDIGVRESDIMVCAALVSQTLADLDTHGVSAEEFSDAKARYQTWLQKNAAAPLTNREYVDLCTANYLYGANMTSRKDAAVFLRGRKISPDRDIALFGRFVSALLDPQRNLTVSCGSPSDTLDVRAFKDAFTGAWKPSASPQAYSVSYADTLALYYPSGRKVKLRREETEPLTGGKLWTFKNRMTVVFRKTSESGLRYCLLTRGGVADIPGLEKGESAYVGDMLGLYDVCGMNPAQFHNMLESNGINMECKVGISDMRISGSAPGGKLDLVMRSLLSIHKNRSLNLQAFEYYRRCEALRQERFRLMPEGVNAVMDSIMCPDFHYPLSKLWGLPGESLPQKAEEYFNSQFSKCHDGVLYLEGNLEEALLLKYLQKILGNFKTGRSTSVRPILPYQIRSGMSTYSVDGPGAGEGSANLAMAALRPFTMRSWCAFRIALVALRSELVKEMGEMGYSFVLTPQLQLLPVERISVFINCRPCPSDGLPAEIEPADPFEVMNALREAMQRIGSSGLSSVNLKGYKAALEHEMAGEQSNPDYVMEAFLRRVSEGKDMLGNYSYYLSKVTASDVQSVIRALEQGSRVEFIVK